MDWLGFFLPRFSIRKRPLESLSPPRPEDLEHLADLLEMGSRLDLPHPVRTFLVFPSESRARQAAEQLSREGFSCQLRAALDGTGGWVLTAVVQLIPTPGSITRLREQMDAVGSPLDGVYRGWDAPVVY